MFETRTTSKTILFLLCVYPRSHGAATMPPIGSECGCIPRKFTATIGGTINGVPAMGFTKPTSFTARVWFDVERMIGKINMTVFHDPPHNTLLYYNPSQGVVNLKTGDQCKNYYVKHLMRWNKGAGRMIQQSRCVIRDLVKKDVFSMSFLHGINRVRYSLKSTSQRRRMFANYKLPSCQLVNLVLNMSRSQASIGLFGRIEKSDVNPKDLKPVCIAAKENLALGKLALAERLMMRKN